MKNNLNEICSLPLTECERLKLLADFFYDATIEEIDGALSDLTQNMHLVPTVFLIGCLRYTFAYREHLFSWIELADRTAEIVNKRRESLQHLHGLLK